MIDLSPPPHVQAAVSDIHRFITDELGPPYPLRHR